MEIPGAWAVGARLKNKSGAAFIHGAVKFNYIPL